MTIRVLVADDQSMVRAGFRMLLADEQDIEVVAEAENGREAVDKTARFNPGVILMDIRMPELDGLQATRRILAEDNSARILILSDRGVNGTQAPIPMLLAVGAVHHYLIRVGKRLRTDIVAETGEAWDIHHFAVLIGYGASAIHPYVALATAATLPGERGLEELTAEEALLKYRSAVEAGACSRVLTDGVTPIGDLEQAIQLTQGLAGTRSMTASQTPLLRREGDGGVTVETIAEYKRAGADGFGVGSPLFGRQKVAARDWAWVEAQARRFAEAYQTG